MNTDNSLKIEQAKRMLVQNRVDYLRADRRYTTRAMVMSEKQELVRERKLLIEALAAMGVEVKEDDPIPVGATLDGGDGKEPVHA